MKQDERKRIKIRKGLYLVNRNGIWYGEQSNSGKQRRWSLDTSDVNIASKRLLEAANSEDEPVKKSPSKNAPFPISLVFEEYRKWFQDHRRAWRTALPRIENFLDFVGDEMDMRAITRQHVQSWIESHKNLSPSTQKNDFGRVRALIRWFDRMYPGIVNLGAVRASGKAEAPRQRSWRAVRVAEVHPAPLAPKDPKAIRRGGTP